MKVLFKYCILGILSVLFFACADDDENDDNKKDCDEYDICDTIPPVTAKMAVKLTINEQFSSVPVTIYLGEIDDSTIVHRDTATKANYSYPVLVDNYYAVSARYRKNGKTIIAIDGDRVDLSRGDHCTPICYDIDEGKVDLRLLED